MRETVRKVYSVFRNNWGGRLLFVAHVLFMLLLGRYYGSELASFSLPRLVFGIVNLPQFIILHALGIWSLRTALNEPMIVLITSIPWWAYGCAAEYVVRRRARLNRLSEGNRSLAQGALPRFTIYVSQLPATCAMPSSGARTPISRPMDSRSVESLYSSVGSGCS